MRVGCGLAAVAALHAANIRYREELTIEWGPVTHVTANVPATQEMWFTRRAPTFAAGVLTPGQQSYLAEKFNACQGTAAGVTVWGVSDKLIAKFRKKAATEPFPGMSVITISQIDERPPGSPATMTWRLSLQLDIADPDSPPVAEPPTVEILLLVEGVPAGTAWEISPAEALAHPAIVDYAGLTSEEKMLASHSAAWARIFLVSPTFSAADARPAIAALPAADRFAVPVAFGVRALVEAAAILGGLRSAGLRNYEQLEHRLSPEQASAFPHARWWFPEPPETGREFANLSVQTGLTADRLLQISYPTPGRPYDALRVLPEANEWVIQAGPFRLAPVPGVAVTSVQGKTRVYSLAQLREDPAIAPEAKAAYLENIEGLNRELAAALHGVVASAAGQEMRAAGFFWAPAVRDFHASALQALERERFTTAITAKLTASQLAYEARLRPASVVGKVGLTYNPVERAGLDGSIAGRGLLYPDDTLSLSAKSAERAISGALSFRVPYFRSTDRRSTGQLEFFASAGRDDQFRIGGLSADPFDHRFQDAGVEHQYERQFLHWKLTLRNAARWVVHDLRQTGSLGRRRDTGLTLRHREIWSLAFDASDTVRWELAVEPLLEYSPAAGWNRAFWQGEFRARSRVWWGGEKHEAPPMYVGLRAGAGSGSADRPAALLSRLGDADRLIGLEPGEFSGRSFTHGEVVYGVRLAHLVRGLFKTDGQRDPAAIPPVFRTLFIQAGAEIGRVAGTDRTLESYALALETGETGAGSPGIRLGYAWSPLSFRSRGRVFSALTWSF